VRACVLVCPTHRSGLIVVGNRATLSSDANWAAWLAWVDARGLAEEAPP
jgi:hypothetical protein